MNKTIETIPSETMSALAEYSWPGNIRELQNLIERSVILTSGPVLRVPLEELEPASLPKHGPQTDHNAEREFILDTLKKTKWVVAGPNGAAERMGMRRTTLQYRMRKLGILKEWH